MAKKIINKRCPLAPECGKSKCMFEGKELGCDYYFNNAMGDSVIPDQEDRRRLEDAKFLQAQEEQMLAEI